MYTDYHEYIKELKNCFSKPKVEKQKKLVCIQDIKFHKLTIDTSPVLVATYKDKTYQSENWPQTSYGEKVYAFSELRTWVLLKDDYMRFTINGQKIMLYNNSTSFSLTDEQKERLTEMGKEATLDFCNKKVDEEKNKLIDELKEQLIFDSDTNKKLSILIKLPKPVISNLTNIIDAEYNLAINDINDTIAKLESAYNNLLSLRSKIDFDDKMKDTVNALKSKIDYYRNLM